MEKSRFSAIALLVLLEYVGGSLVPHEDRSVVDLLHVCDGGRWGEWHSPKFCPQSTYAIGYYIQVETPDGDDTALNNIMLMCGCRDGSVGVTVSSGFGPFGSSNKHMLCPRVSGEAQFMVEFLLKVQPDQGLNGDNTAANDIKFKCGSLKTGSGAASVIHAPGGTEWGNWSQTWSNRCPEHSAICGIKTKIESWQGSRTDDTSLKDVKFYCCDD
ncbi:vitelline membrane outer layer protein 1 homolog [Dreissena polymorpha]|uniref:Vitelline membrane outer layer protein 1 homolog n=1 Tax=Dreissena polymorpha TaxID=45954 RepID=A0A9D4CPM5_DREPO|nr:vitelline membrane outer layer protein 1 homolog [Dreissena polymorpha]KAH3729289.1 hypothetical protein DPMN_055257 [Dreissena polymorpha]